MSDKKSNLNHEYWNRRFENNDTPWDVGSISEPLKAYIEQLENKEIAILIPGCGKGHEINYLLQKGFTRITAVDISIATTEVLQQQFAAWYGKQLSIITGDFFRLTGQYDLIIEQTFFCAIDPAMRNEYVKQIYALLKPAGKLAGVLFNRSFEGGPPFGGTKEEYEVLFEQYFQIKTMEPCYNSIPPRNGTELFFIAIKKKAPLSN